MDINEIKQVPIVDFLYILGIEPVKHKASGLWYHAPYRNDRNPSLRVSTDKNVWYDYGIARGGDIFNLAGEFINSNEFVAQAKFISETLGGSFPTSFQHYQRTEEKAVKAKGNPFSDIVEKPLSHPALRQYLRERGISADVASRFCCQVEYRYNGKQFFAVGFKNNSDGYEIRNRFFKGCVSPKDITLIGRNSNVCHLYEGFMDFLSAVILGIGRGEDHIVLNSVANMQKVHHLLDGYAQVYCHLDNDEAGENACVELQEAEFIDNLNHDATEKAATIDHQEEVSGNESGNESGEEPAKVWVKNNPPTAEDSREVPAEPPVHNPKSWTLGGRIKNGLKKIAEDLDIITYDDENYK